MYRRAKYEINSYGNEYYSSTSFANTYEDAVLKYDQDVLSAKYLYEYESDSVPEHIAISIKDLETCKIVKSTYIRID